MRYDTAIIGGGIAGYTAALTAKNLKMSYIWFADDFSEKTARAEYVRNFPSFIGDGVAFVKALSAQKEKEGVVSFNRRIDGVYEDGEGYTLTAGQESFFARTVILATGVNQNTVRGERELLGRGVSYCAVCDGALYKGKVVAALIEKPEYAEEVEYLSSFAREVLCFAPFDISFRNENVKVYTGTLAAIEGIERVERIMTSEGTMSADGVFLLRTCTPPSALVGGLETDGERVLTARDASTNLKGLFAAGDVTGRPYQYVKAAGEGCVAAYSARAFLSEKA